MLFAIRSALNAFPLSPALLMLRIALAILFWRSGLTKVATTASGMLPELPPRLATGVVEIFANEYRVPLLPPDIAAMLGAGGELILSALLLFGLFGRFAAAGLLVVTAVIQWVYPGNWSEHLLWAGCLLLLIIRGPGSLSLDRLFWEPPQARFRR